MTKACIKISIYEAEIYDKIFKDTFYIFSDIKDSFEFKM